MLYILTEEAPQRFYNHLSLLLELCVAMTISESDRYNALIEVLF